MQGFGEFSEFELDEFGVKFPEEDTYSVAGAVGNLEESMNSKTVVKKYRGVESKTRTKGTGAGEVKISMHIAYEVYKKMYGMNLDTLIDGVCAYGQNSVHPVFASTTKVRDEDGNVKFKAYPNCTVKEGMARKVENGAEEVAEIELTIAVMPDETGNGLYEALADDLSEEVAGKWMTDFTPEMVQVATV